MPTLSPTVPPELLTGISEIDKEHEGLLWLLDQMLDATSNNEKRVLHPQLYTEWLLHIESEERIFTNAISEKNSKLHMKLHSLIATDILLLSHMLDSGVDTETITSFINSIKHTVLAHFEYDHAVLPHTKQ